VKCSLLLIAVPFTLAKVPFSCSAVRISKVAPINGTKLFSSLMFRVPPRVAVPVTIQQVELAGLGAGYVGIQCTRGTLGVSTSDRQLAHRGCRTPGITVPEEETPAAMFPPLPKSEPLVIITVPVPEVVRSP
jgi:hypothetical protein